MDSRLGNQLRTLSGLLATLRPFFFRDYNLPARIQKALTSERRFGARDRRLYRELLFTVVRYLPWFCALETRSGEDLALRAMVWLAATTTATVPLQTEVIREFGPPGDTIPEKAARLGLTHLPLVPDWLQVECPEACASPNLDVLHTRAPLWVRLQAQDETRVLDEFKAHGWEWQRSSFLPGVLKFSGDIDLTQTEAFARGEIEIQDIGSQLVLASVAVMRGETWLDACAGAGGKSLQLGQAVGPKGSVVAHDIRPEALRELADRARRARLDNIKIQATPTGQFDGVLVDAPCTGSGTWRRSPHLKNLTRRADVFAAAEVQLRLVRQFSQHVRPGGRLVYATCSLCRTENAELVKKFLEQTPSFVPAESANELGLSQSGAGWSIFPAAFDGDGFFVANLCRQ